MSNAAVNLFACKWLFESLRSKYQNAKLDLIH